MTTEMMNTNAYGHSALRGASHLNWLIERNDAFIREHFYVDWAGDPFVKIVNGVERRMLTLFARNDMPKSKCVNFLYTGRLIDNVMYADGRYKHLAVHCLDGRDLWTIPPEGFNIDTMSVVHPAHLIHQPEDFAHFNISKHGRMIYIQQIKGWRKNQRLFLNYGHCGEKLWRDDYVQLKKADYICPGDGDPIDRESDSDQSGPDGAAEDTALPRRSSRFASDLNVTAAGDTHSTAAISSGGR